MGWWSTTIMSGDDPLDGEGWIMNEIGIKYEFESGSYDSVQSKKRLEVEQENILAKIDKEIENGYYESNFIYKQVLGVLLMRYGCSIKQNVKEQIIEAANSDTWSSGNLERKKHLDEFVNTLNEYEGEPTEITSEGLFQKIAQHLGKNGPVNL